MPRYSRRATVEEKRNRRSAFLYILLSILAVLVLFFFGITAIAKFAGFISDLKQSSEPIGAEDTTPPAPPRFTNIPEYTNESEISIEGNAEPGSTLVLEVNNQKKEQLVGNDGRFSLTAELTGGENTLNAKAIDNAGNESQSTETFRIVVDKNPPDLTITSPQDKSSYYGSRERQLVIEGETEGDANITINDRIVVVNSEGHFTYAISLQEGENIFTVIAKDKAGNETKQEFTVNFYP